MINIRKILKIVLLKIVNNNTRADLLKKEGVRMGYNCQVFNRCSFGSEPYLIQFGNYVKVTSGCEFITHDGGIEVLRNLKGLKDADKFGRIVVGNNVFFGNNCTVLPGVTIGNNVVIGACSLVNKDIPDNCVAAGVPAKVIETIDEYYEKVKDVIDYTHLLKYKEKKAYLCKKYSIL